MAGQSAVILLHSSFSSELGAYRWLFYRFIVMNASGEIPPVFLFCGTKLARTAGSSSLFRDCCRRITPTSGFVCNTALRAYCV